MIPYELYLNLQPWSPLFSLGNVGERPWIVPSFWQLNCPKWNTWSCWDADQTLQLSHPALKLSWQFVAKSWSSGCLFQNVDDFDHDLSWNKMEQERLNYLYSEKHWINTAWPSGSAQVSGPLGFQRLWDAQGRGHDGVGARQSGSLWPSKVWGNWWRQRYCRTTMRYNESRISSNFWLALRPADSAFHFLEINKGLTTVLSKTTNAKQCMTKICGSWRCFVQYLSISTIFTLYNSKMYSFLHWPLDRYDMRHLFPEVSANNLQTLWTS